MKDTKIFRILKNDKTNVKMNYEIKEKPIEDTEIHLEGIFFRF